MSEQDVALGRCVEMGELTLAQGTVDQPGSLYAIPRAIVIQFTTVDELKKAIKTGSVKFGAFEPPRL